MPLAAKLLQLQDDLLPIEDAHERLALVVDRARLRPPLPDSERIDANRLRGCVSQAWLVGELRAGFCHFRSDADSPLVRGLLDCVAEFFSGASPTEIAAWETDPLAEIRLTQQLTPTRQRGLASARHRIREYARTAAASVQSS